MSDAADRLLYALSWWGSVDWSRYVAAFDELNRGERFSEGVNYLRREAALTLDSLGHCEVHFERGGGRLSIAPATLAALPLPGLPRAVLCGARSSSTASEVVAAAKSFGSRVDVEVAPGAEFAPSRIEVEAESSEMLRTFAESLGIPYSDYPPALAVAAASGSLEEKLRSLVWQSGPELNWQKFDFEPRAARFGYPTGVRGDTRLTRYEGGFQGRRYLMWHYDQFADADPFWGRYAMFSVSQLEVLSYDPVAMQVYVPRDAALPRLLARALVLCGGEPATPVDYASSRLATTRFRVYSRVPPDVFNAVATKLSQTPYAPRRLEPAH